MNIDNTYPLTVQLMQQGLTLTRQLYALLIDEAEILNRARHSDMLTQLTAKKHQVVSELNQFTLQISQILAANNLPAGNDGINEYIVLLKTAGLSSNEIQNNWSEITKLTKQNKLLNEQNGASIELLTRHVQRTMLILNGESLVTQTYGPNGITNNQVNSHSLASV